VDVIWADRVRKSRAVSHPHLYVHASGP